MGCTFMEEYVRFHQVHNKGLQRVVDFRFAMGLSGGVKHLTNQARFKVGLSVCSGSNRENLRWLCPSADGAVQPSTQMVLVTLGAIKNK